MERGSNVDETWMEHRLNMDGTRMEQGRNMDGIWMEHGRSMDRAWVEHEQNMDGTWMERRLFSVCKHFENIWKILHKSVCITYDRFYRNTNFSFSIFKGL